MTNEEITKTLQRVLDSMNMKNVTIEHDTVENYMGDEVDCVIVDGWIMIYPEPILFELLDGTVKMNPGFALDVMIVNHNYPHEPDDCEYVRTEHSSGFAIVSAVVSKIFMNHLENVMENIYIESFQKEKIEDLDLPF